MLMKVNTFTGFGKARSTSALEIGIGPDGEQPDGRSNTPRLTTSTACPVGETKETGEPRGGARASNRGGGGGAGRWGLRRSFPRAMPSEGPPPPNGGQASTWGRAGHQRGDKSRTAMEIQGAPKPIQISTPLVPRPGA